MASWGRKPRRVVWLCAGEITAESMFQNSKSGPEEGSSANVRRQVHGGADPRSRSSPRSKETTLTVLRGRRLTIARAVGVAMFLLAAASFILGLLPSFEEFRTLSVYEDAGVREITRVNLAQLGLSVEFYACREGPTD
jgi:hypothetical protein